MLLKDSCHMILYCLLIRNHILCILQPIQIDPEGLTLEDSVYGIISEAIQPNESVLIINSDDLVLYTMKKLAKKFTIFNLNTNDIRAFNLIDGAVSGLTICFSTSPNYLDTVLKTVKFISADNPKGITLIVDSSRDLEEKVVPYYFGVLWKHSYIKALITRIGENGTRPIFDIFKWNALAPSGLCGKNSSSYEKVRIYRSEKKSQKFSQIHEIFNNMLPPKDSINCTIKVGVSAYPPNVFPAETIDPRTKEYVFDHGFEVKLIKSIANKLGLVLKFQSFNHTLNGNTLDENGAALGLFKHLLEGDLDIGLSSFTYMKPNEFIDYGPPYAVEDIIWCVPRVLPFAPEIRLMFPFGFTNFILYLMASILTGSGICLLSTFRKGEPKFNQKLENCLFRYVADMFGTSYNLNTPKHFKIRILHVMWLFTKLLMISLYCSTIFSFFTINNDKQKYKTLSDMLNSDLRFLIFSNKFSKIARNILPENRIFPCSSVQDCLERVAVSRDAALILSKYVIMKKHCFAVDCQIRTNLVSFPITMIFRKNHVLFNSINTEILHLLEAGLISYWKNEAVRAADGKIPNKALNDFLELDEMPLSRVITYANLQSAFNIGLTGHILSILVFLLELVLYLKRYFKKYHIEFRN